MLFYCPLEQYKERYTHQLSAPNSGWWEANWLAAGIEYKRIDGIGHVEYGGHISIGEVLDAFGRSFHCFDQIKELLGYAATGELTERDVVYFDDFWHPGIEALRYAFDQMGKAPPKMFAFCWAQTADEFDFSHKMRDWMVHFERGIGQILDGVFVANTLLKQLLINQCCILYGDKIHVVGLPFDSHEVMGRMPELYQAYMAGVVTDEHARREPRKNKVIFSSRWDEEKNPRFFLKVVKALLAIRNDVEFVICTSAKELRSNNPDLLDELHLALVQHGPQLQLKEDLTKEQYYQELCSAKVQFNCASQDWISFTLLEASVAGCWPVYPSYRSFPETFTRSKSIKTETYFPCMYAHLDVESAIEAINWALHLPEIAWHRQAIENRSWIHRRFDNTWMRILYHMRLATTSAAKLSAGYPNYRSKLVKLNEYLTEYPPQ